MLVIRRCSRRLATTQLCVHTPPSQKFVSVRRRFFASVAADNNHARPSPELLSTLKNLGFSDQWIKNDSKWIGVSTFNLTKTQTHLHKIKRHTPPEIRNQKGEDVDSIFLVNPSLLPERNAGYQNAEWKRHRTAAMLLRPEFLNARKALFDEDYLKDGHLVLVRGAKRCGKSALLNYMGMLARQENWLTVWIWDATKASTKPYRIHKATDRFEVFYQPEFCRIFFQSLLDSSSDVLKKIKLKRKYTGESNPASTSSKDSVPATMASQQTTTATNKSDTPVSSPSSSSDEDENGDDEDEDEDEDGERELTAEEFVMLQKQTKEGRDQAEEVKASRSEETVNAAFDELRKSYHEMDATTGFNTGDRESATLFDLVTFGASDDCVNSAALFYDFVDELKKVDEVPVLVAIDNINMWDHKIAEHMGYRSPDGEVLEHYQHSFVDALSGLLKKGQLKRGVVATAFTGVSPVFRSKQLMRSASKTVKVPRKLSPGQFDVLLEHYRAIGVLHVDNDRHRAKIEGLSERVAGETYRIAELY